MSRTLVLVLVVICSVVGAAAVASAHVDQDLVAVAAGEQVTVRFEPTHGCGGSPTVGVTVRAPVEGAVPVDVDGWTSSSTPDGAGTTVIEWTGGSLPADQVVAFPVEFTVPDTPGELLTFPSVQICEDGNELSWDSDQAAQFPAPRLLVLPAGSVAAATIDDVPPDAPGRDLLVRIVDVDNPATAPTTTAPVETTTTTTEPAPTEPDVSLVQPTEPPADVVAPAPAKKDDGRSPIPYVIGGVLLVAVVAGGVFYLRARRRRSDVEATL